MQEPRIKILRVRAFLSFDNMHAGRHSPTHLGVFMNRAGSILLNSKAGNLRFPAKLVRFSY